MAEVNWTDLAIENITDIANYISIDSVTYAELFVRKLFEKVTILESFPESGRVVPEFESNNLRELIFGNYKVVYKIIGELPFSKSPLFEN
jgi:toxin ParE1/3/4